MTQTSENLDLKYYQSDCIQEVKDAFDRGDTRSLVVMATGLGKTVVMAAMANETLKKVFGLMHRDTLISQACSTFLRWAPGRYVGIEKGEKRASVDDDIVLASVQSVGKKDRSRLSRFPKDWPGLMWVDEVHHAPSGSYLEVLDHFGFYGDNPRRDIPLVGTTATPDRLDELGYDKIFDDVAFRYGLREAIRDGFLADIRAWRIGTDLTLEGVRKRGGDFVEKDLAGAVERSRVDEAVVSTWKERCQGKRSLFFCVDKAHAGRIVERLRAEGASAEMVVDSTKKPDRERTIDAFRGGHLDCLVGVEVFTEGFDVPECDAIHIVRPTGSGALYQQMIGRGTRLSSGKEAMDLFDYTPAEHDVFSVGRIFGLPDSWDYKGKSVSGDADEVEELESQLGLKVDGAKSVEDLRIRVKRDRIQLVKGALADTGLPSRFAWIRPNPSREKWVVAWRNETKNNIEKVHEKHRETVGKTYEEKKLWGVRERVEIIRNELGIYETILHRTGPSGSNQNQGKLFSDRSLHKLVSRTEKMIEEGRPHKVILLDKKASWGKKEATDAQKEMLSRKGVPSEIAVHLSRRESSCLMGMPEETIKQWFSEV